MESALNDVIDVLYRNVEVNALSALNAAVKSGDESPHHSFKDYAICLDTNILLKVANAANASDLVDYLGTRHLGPLIVPSQVVQEYWNNNISVLVGVADQIKQKFDELQRLIDTLNPSYEQLLTKKISPILDDFRTEFGYVLDDRRAASISSLIEMLESRAVSPQAPREGFTELADHRKRTKTPPGFRDAGDGDFFVWVDFLLGLKRARDDGDTFSCVVLVTDDVKKDWSTQGTAHPTLAAEVKALVNVPFEAWNLKKFVARVSLEIKA